MSTPNFKVSVVMTSYNRERYISQAIDSILSQECSYPIEIIIGDDYSTDSSRLILQSYKERYPEVFVLNLQPHNVGFGPNWASTLQLATGKYVAFLDDDDYWCDTHRLQEMVTYMETTPDCGLIYTNRWVEDVDHGKRWIADAFIPDNVDVVNYLYSKSFPILFSSVLLRRSLVEQYVKLGDYIHLNFPIQDWPTALLLASHCSFHYIPQPSVVYRYYSGSMSKPKEYEQILTKYAKEEIMYKYVSEQIGRCFNKADWDNYVSGLCLSLAYSRFDFSSAKEYARQTGQTHLKVCASRCSVLFFPLAVFLKIKEYIKHL